MKQTYEAWADGPAGTRDRPCHIHSSFRTCPTRHTQKHTLLSHCFPRKHLGGLERPGCGTEAQSAFHTEARLRLPERAATQGAGDQQAGARRHVRVSVPAWEIITQAVTEPGLHVVFEIFASVSQRCFSVVETSLLGGATNAWAMSSASSALRQPIDGVRSTSWLART